MKVESAAEREIQMIEAEAPRRRLRQLEVMVAERIVETHDTTTLVLFAGNEPLDYEAGNFLTIDPHQFKALDRFTRFLEDLKGKREPPRAYSLASAPYERHLAITIKEEPYTSGQTKYPPLLSPLLVHRMPVGARMVITGFTGPFTLPKDPEGRIEHIVHICAGSGVVPSYSILKQDLVMGSRLRHTLIFSNKTRQDVIYGRHLQALAEKHPERFTYVQTLTRELDGSVFGPQVRRGRISRELITELVPDPGSAHFMVCGPGITTFERREAKARGEEPQPRFLETAVKYLKELGVDRKRISQEAYG
ncbi:MAG: oxidoreductase [Myxococcales bacterium]